VGMMGSDQTGWVGKGEHENQYRHGRGGGENARLMYIKDEG